MARNLAGSKMRERRKSLGITQVSLAGRLGISASYLNLIEANRRNIGGALLKRIADELGVPIDQFDGTAQRRLVEDLGLISADSIVAPLALEPASAAALVSSPHAGWARALVSLHRAYLDRNAAFNAMSDRLNHDPVLGETVHNMLTHVTAIRSASEILESDGGMDSRQRQRFVDIIAHDSRRLSDVSRKVAGLFTRSQTVSWPISPTEEIDDFLAEHDNHFPRLEQAAADLRKAAGLDGEHADAALTRYLAHVHGLASAQPVRTFRLAQRAAELGARDAIAAEIGASPSLAVSAAKARVERVLASYVAGAMLMPYADFHAAAVATRYDIDRLCDTFHASFEQVCHRLVTLRRPGAEGVRFGFMRSDPAGYAGKRFALPQWPQPRYGPACPLWAVYAAFQTPGGTVRQLAEFPGGERYLLVARAIEKQRAAYGMPRHFMSVMLVCEAMYADQLVYGDGLDFSSGAPSTPVGPGCRVCTRQDCNYRQQDAVVGVFARPAGS